MVDPASTWYPAEAYHQDYPRKHPGGYTCHSLRGQGTDARHRGKLCLRSASTDTMVSVDTMV